MFSPSAQAFIKGLQPGWALRVLGFRSAGSITSFWRRSLQIAAWPRLGGAPSEVM